MFRCHFCNQVTPPGTKKQNVVIATREKTYPSRRSENKRGGGRFRPRNDSHGDVGGKGVETTQEVPACPVCAAKQESVAPVMVAEEVAPAVDPTAETAAATEASSTDDKSSSEQASS